MYLYINYIIYLSYFSYYFTDWSVFIQLRQLKILENITIALDTEFHMVVLKININQFDNLAIKIKCLCQITEILLYIFVIIVAIFN